MSEETWIVQRAVSGTTHEVVVACREDGRCRVRAEDHLWSTDARTAVERFARWMGWQVSGIYEPGFISRAELDDLAGLKFSMRGHATLSEQRVREAVAMKHAGGAR